MILLPHFRGQGRSLRLAMFTALSSLTLNAATVISPSAGLPSSAADTSKPGFLWRVHQTEASQPTTLARTEAQLSGSLGDNIADPFALGSADAEAATPATTTEPIEFIISSVINFDQEGGDAGSIAGDTTIPGIPGSFGGTDNVAAEVLTWLDLPAGDIVMGVNSDDGFRLTIGGANPNDKFGTNVGEFEGGRGAGDTIMRFTIAKAGLYAARLIYNEGTGDARVEWWTQALDGAKTLINDPAEGSIKAYRALNAGNVQAFISLASPSMGQTGVAPNALLQVDLTEGSAVINPSSVKLILDGTTLAATTTKSGPVISSRFTPSGLYDPASVHQVSLVYTEGAISKTNNYSFTVAPYGTLEPTAKVVPDTSKPGFIWSIFANSGAIETSIKRAENALNGLLQDSEGNFLPNLADPSNVGVALAEAAAPASENAPIRFEIPGVINLAENGADDSANQNGNFTPDLQMPGVSGDMDGMAAEAITYIELPAGVVTMGINSDDGFITTTGNPKDFFQSINLGSFNAGRGASDTTFSMFVKEAGVYAFRTLWFEGTGGANIEWFTVKADGTKTLVNDVANGGFKAYRALLGGTQPAITSVSPSVINAIADQSASSVVITIADGSNPVLDSSIALKIDGQLANVTQSRSGNVVTLTYTPTTLYMPYEAHTAELSFSAAGGAFTRTQQWQFRNLKNIVLPSPVLTENFDSYDEGSIPTGWVEKNYTDVRTAGLDLDNLNSDTYLGWVVVSKARLEILKSRIFGTLAPNQMVNGELLTTLGDGNILYAESDARGGNQVQFIVSKPFNLSTITNVVMSFASLYEQNQDNVGAVEYSVDGGLTWLPVLYYIDIGDSGGDIIYRPDGTVDAVATFRKPNMDTAVWTDNGVLKGQNYGDAILAPITSALDTYIAPRHNDNSTIDKLLEVVRLPQAGGKADVRLRFAQIGTGSWYFGVDDISFYEGPVPPVTSTTETTLAIAKTDSGQVTLSWTGNGVLESSSSVVNGWAADANQANPQTIAPAGTRFYRIRNN
ncbi:MAG: hypothetical protein ACO1QB_04330 [Verrucomicrobiales bacterium]